MVLTMIITMLLTSTLTGDSISLDQRKLLMEGNVMAQTLQNKGVKWDSNENGIWGLPSGGGGGGEGEGGRRDTVVVIGGSDFSTVGLLLDLGYVVWGRRATCGNKDCCREPFGYAAYLADTTFPQKPIRKYITFIHGHLHSWHQRRSFETLLDESLQCTSQTGRYSSLSWTYQISVSSWIEEHDFLGNWKNSSLEQHLPSPSSINSFLGAQFTITEGSLLLRPTSFYKQLLKAVSPDSDDRCELNGYDLEFFWGWIFGEGADIDPTQRDLYPAGTCSNFVLKPAITAPHAKWNPHCRMTHSHDSEGIWMYPTTGLDLRIMLVFGSDPTSSSTSKLIESLMSSPLGGHFGFWIRQPNYLCPYGDMNAKQYLGATPCSYTEGYSRFMNHYGIDSVAVEGADEKDLQTDVFVFISGEEDDVSWQTILESAKRSVRRGGYYPLLGSSSSSSSFPKRHSHPTVVNPWPKESRLQVPGQGFATADFAVPSKKIYDIDVVKVGYTRELTTPLILLEPEYLKFYWHCIVGESCLLTTDTIDASDCLHELLMSSDSVDSSNLENLHMSWFTWMDFEGFKRATYMAAVNGPSPIVNQVPVVNKTNEGNSNSNSDSESLRTDPARPAKLMSTSGTDSSCDFILVFTQVGMVTVAVGTLFILYKRYSASQTPFADPLKYQLLEEESL
eukprot:TRINITY_DN4050_c0_g1_i1.p1 TRINITY_DN4050_c0_g1~~TRINITY_DN4050_c0_g1_i1.p1  ORF type:complete len:675 (+),score=149.20 TRINITY_DN4050_c0_g1_i1:72-2096(+)